MQEVQTALKCLEACVELTLDTAQAEGAAEAEAKCKEMQGKLSEQGQELRLASEARVRAEERARLAALRQLVPECAEGAF